MYFVVVIFYFYGKLHIIIFVPALKKSSSFQKVSAEKNAAM